MEALFHAVRVVKHWESGSRNSDTLLGTGLVAAAEQIVDAGPMEGSPPPLLQMKY